MNITDLRLLAEGRERVRDGRSAREIRRRSGITLAQMARVLEVSESAISRWESGSRQPRGAVAVQWARVLDELDRAQQSTPAAA